MGLPPLQVLLLESYLPWETLSSLTPQPLVQLCGDGVWGAPKPAGHAGHEKGRERARLTKRPLHRSLFTQGRLVGSTNIRAARHSAREIFSSSLSANLYSHADEVPAAVAEQNGG